ncbi:hypothetical protein V6582_14820 [Agrobacterium vitis]|uniref:hypothetical protein n=1 Tax=Agrobacterium vitis TaxID=373 RepID=UPI0012E8D45A|nr:hypothetical protein [Agrobacterium vitis]MVA26884.1 hypothetical protein [Agrobacterium vitis]
MTLLKQLHNRVTGLIVTTAALLFCLAVIAFAAAPALASTADTSYITDLLSAILPPVFSLAITLIATAGAWLVSRLVGLIGISDTAKRLEVEAKLRDCLHFAAENGLRFALTKAGLPAVAGPAAAVVADAMFYVREKNPQTLEKLGVNDKALEDIILSKWPTASLSLPIAAHWSSIPKT